MMTIRVVIFSLYNLDFHDTMALTVFLLCLKNVTIIYSVKSVQDTSVIITGNFGTLHELR